MKCPWYEDGKKCEGELKLVGDGSTYVGYMNGVDENVRTETFECDKCGRRFMREWQWMLA